MLILVVMEANSPAADVELLKVVLESVLGMVSTAVGFFLALYFNNRIEKKKELATFSNIKKSISLEIEHNEVVLNGSFKMHMGGYYFFNAFNTNVASNYLTDIVFIKYASNDMVHSLQEYVNACTLANSRKDQLKSFRIAGYRNEWTTALEDALSESFGEIGVAIKNAHAKFAGTQG
jgi:hypothetical protein